MTYSLQATTWPSIVVDANLGAGAVLAIRGLENVPALFERWAEDKRNLFAPDWWMAEVVSVIRQHVFRKMVSLEQAHQAVDDLESLEVTTFPMTFELLHNALNWAEKIGQSRVYDSLYLALAEHLNAELWTADQRLVNSARALKIGWVKWIGDSE
jgi:predicted nucleic acid-binding protein